MLIISGTIPGISRDELLERTEEVAADFGCVIQVFDAKYIVCTEHLERAVELANRSIKRNEAVARDPAVEILLYAAGRRQIDQALEMGLRTDSEEIVVVVAPDPSTRPLTATNEREGEIVDRLGECIDLGTWAPGSNFDAELVAEYFDITNLERTASAADLCTLVCERVALLEVEK